MAERIAHVLFPRPSALRPVSEFALDAAWALEAQGLEVELLVPVPVRAMRRLGSLSRALSGARRWPEGLEQSLRALSPRPVLVPYLPWPGRSIESAALALSAHLIHRPLSRRPEVVQGSFLDEGGYAAVCAARAAGLPSIAVAHGTDVRAARGQLEDHAKRRRARWALHHASRVVAVSHGLAAELALLGARAEIIPFTARASDFPHSPLPSRPRVLFVGRVERAKGVDLLLEAFSRVQTPGATLELIGRDSGEVQLGGLGERVRLLPEVPRSALPEAYARARLLVLPSRAEGLPCVLVEALLCGRPVVATDVGSVAEVVRAETGKLVPPEDPAALAAAIDQTLSRAWSPERLRAAALPYAWEESGPALARLTAELRRATIDVRA